MSGFDFKFKSQRISENKASGPCEDHLVLICHILICEESFYKKIILIKHEKLKLRKITKKCSRFSDKVSNKIDLLAYDHHIDRPPAWELK